MNCDIHKDVEMVRTHPSKKKTVMVCPRCKAGEEEWLNRMPLKPEAMTAPVVVRRCCRNCKHHEEKIEESEHFGLYHADRCKEYQKVVDTFPIWTRVRHMGLVVNPTEINSCRHYEQKELSEAPLFEATSA